MPGITRDRFSPVLAGVTRKLSHWGYRVGDPIRVNAADYAVPQRRVRCLLLATHKSAPPELPDAVTPQGRRMTVADAIKELPRLESGEADPSDPLHVARDHQKIALERLATIPSNGGGRESLPDHLTLACHVDHKGHPDVYGRMAWDDIAPTLTTGCTDVTKGRFAHPENHRAITLREAARLQTFPDEYGFCGNASEIARQIGNAVPVKFIEELAMTLRGAVRR